MADLRPTELNAVENVRFAKTKFLSLTLKIFTDGRRPSEPT